MIFRFFLMTLFPSTLVYTLCLVLYVVFSASFLVTYDLVPGLIALLVTLVYVGAIIVIISYICAVSPNIKYYRTILHNLSLLLFLVYSLVALLGSIVLYTMPLDVSLTPSVLFSDIGVIGLCLVCLFIVLVLMFATYVNPTAASFRSSRVNN